MRSSTITEPSIEQKKVFYSTMDKFIKSQKLKEKNYSVFTTISSWNTEKFKQKTKDKRLL